MGRHVQLFDWHCMYLYHLWETLNNIWSMSVSPDFRKMRKKGNQCWSNNTFMKNSIAKNQHFLHQQLV